MILQVQKNSERFGHPKHCRKFEPSHQIMPLFVLRKLILPTRMRSHPVGLIVWFLVGPFVYFHTSIVRTAKALARLRGCAGSPEPLLVAYVISTIISRAGSFNHTVMRPNDIYGKQCRPYQIASSGLPKPASDKYDLLPYATL